MVQVLICTPVVFLVGGLLLMERRCLGQLALVQPMVVLLITGHMLDQTLTGIWLGVSIQLLSSGQSHYCNWALTGIVAAGSLIVLDAFDIAIEAGTPATVLLIILGLAAGILADQFELRQSRRDSNSKRQKNPWESADPIAAFGRLVHLRMLRGFFQGGLQSILGVALASGTAYFARDFLVVETDNIKHVLVAIPAFGIAVSLSSLSEYRYAAYAAVGLLSFVTMVVFI